MFEQLPSRAPSIQSNATRRPPSEAIDDTPFDDHPVDHGDLQLHAPDRKMAGESTQRWWEMSLVLKNTGSVARDHLASERTFLAWMRTSVSLAMAGVAVAQLFRLSKPARPPLQLPSDAAVDPTSSNADAQRRLLETLDAYYSALTYDLETSNRNRRFAKPLGGLLIATGLITMLIGMYRYFLTQHLLTRDQYSATRTPVFFISALTGSIMIVIFGCLLGSAR
ncbi:hypothetical protein FFLO_00806 [Filobasidium floriforme]|uniref:DUF202 domain-containing protein n=1 Tax=Filobasidium floriforme TaxID=5210 RepID=A0A8K0JRU9_9TREE|nr:uncharacterized protein HD553DRAFT_226270 [Filobasidium floriforme]KAG7571294.1 hypothetical protein FFLO_00806 [Filobasidium floriforme]KAH8085826.1 hypothetical protein HD553DRAFT_226270 [Filobasidium floriforme]